MQPLNDNEGNQDVAEGRDGMLILLRGSRRTEECPGRRLALLLWNNDDHFFLIRRKGGEWKVESGKRVNRIKKESNGRKERKKRDADSCHCHLWRKGAFVS